MKEVTEEIERLQARLIAAGGGRIVITEEDFTIRLGKPTEEERKRQAIMEDTFSYSDDPLGIGESFSVGDDGEPMI